MTLWKVFNYNTDTMMFTFNEHPECTFTLNQYDEIREVWDEPGADIDTLIYALWDAYGPPADPFVDFFIEPL